MFIPHLSRDREGVSYFLRKEQVYEIIAMADIKAELQAVAKQMEQLMMEKKQDEMLKFYLDDVRALPPGAPMVVGKDALKAFFGVMAKFMEKISKVEGTVVDAVSMGDQASSVNASVAYDKDGNVLDNGKSLTLWKKVDGNWRIQWTSWSSDKPAPPPQ